jgi:hypothetical protein
MYKIGRIEHSSASLKDEVDAVYSELLEADAEYPYLINVRNFVPRILDFENHLQRYFVFNIARKQAYCRHGITSKYPTACAVGSDLPHFTVEYIKSKSPAVYFSNPDQVDAFSYPSQYGSPLFSRAGKQASDLLISGTASIIGSETVHPGNLAAQFETTMLNIQKLITSSCIISPNLIYTTYVKNKNDMEQVQDLLSGNGIFSRLVCTDICRDDLLVEIEAYSKEIYD